MVCSSTCLLSVGLLISMIYFYNATYQSPVVKMYRQRLGAELASRYDKIAEERKNISTRGYLLGLLLSGLAIYYNQVISVDKMDISQLVCLVIVISFFTNYFYYMLSPKSDWMLNHIKTNEQNKIWLEMYRTMQFNYHMGFVIGIIAVGVFAFSFRC